jgi:hypothetical protein
MQNSVYLHFIKTIVARDDKLSDCGALLELHRDVLLISQLGILHIYKGHVDRRKTVVFIDINSFGSIDDGGAIVNGSYPARCLEGLAGTVFDKTLSEFN